MIHLLFQVTLWPNGDIAFVYIEVQPVLTTAALYDHEPVAGISGKTQKIVLKSMVVLLGKLNKYLHVAFISFRLFFPHPPLKARGEVISIIKAV